MFSVRIAPGVTYSLMNHNRLMSGVHQEFWSRILHSNLQDQNLVNSQLRCTDLKFEPLSLPIRD